MGKVLFLKVSVYSHPGTPLPYHNTSIHWPYVLSLGGTPEPGSMSLPGEEPHSGTPIQSKIMVPQSSPDRGYPHPDLASHNSWKLNFHEIEFHGEYIET